VGGERRRLKRSKHKKRKEKNEIHGPHVKRQFYIFVYN
jgi:hypothetical protein